jgi:surface antigen
MHSNVRRVATSFAALLLLAVFAGPSLVGTVKAAPSQWGLPPGYRWGWVNTDRYDRYGNAAAKAYPYGQCTWGAAYLARHNAYSLHNAKDWTYFARMKGLHTGTAPRLNATVVFAPHIQGAGSLGHVAHVVQIIGSGWFVIKEMNFNWNGGGWGRWDYRYAHAGSGVTFIYASY